MNTRIEKDFFCKMAIHYNGEFWVNTYTITLSLLVEECKNSDEPSIAMERISYYIENCIQSSLLIDQAEIETIARYKMAGIRTCELPGEPHDQTVASILLLKFNSIMDGRMKITDLLIGSSMSDGVRYNIVSEVAESFYSGNHWWNKPCLTINEEAVIVNDDNVVKLFENDPWLEAGFAWDKTDY